MTVDDTARNGPMQWGTEAGVPSSDVGPFFGELYLRSTRPFLSADLTRAEVDCIERHLAIETQSAPVRVLDVGCGHGRHLERLSERLGPGRVELWGLDFEAGSCAEASQWAKVVQGEFARLPFADATFSGAWAWYNALFSFDDDEEIRKYFREVARVLRPGGRFVLDAVSAAWASQRESPDYVGPLPGDLWLEEKVRWEPENGGDRISRSLRLPDGRTLSATFFVRYFTPAALQDLLVQTGFRPLVIEGGLLGEAPSDASPDLVVGAERV